ncbi:MAG: hypothetical protein ACLQVY_00235 [Limisphaerales bacterium]
MLNSNAVRFLIVGGHAVTFHGSPRFTADLDLWVATDAENSGRVNQSLKEFGFGNLFGPDDFSKPGYAIQLGRLPYRIDILTSIQGVDFTAAYARRRILKADGLELPFIGLDDLLVNKRAVGRLHDLDDAAKLASGLGRKIKKVKSAHTGKPKKRDAHGRKG